MVSVANFPPFLVGSKDDIATDNYIVTTEIRYCSVYEEGLWLDLYLLEII